MILSWKRNPHNRGHDDHAAVPPDHCPPDYDHAAADDSDTDNHKHSFNHDYCGTNDDGDISGACF